MPSFAKTDENFIAHEVEIRVHDEKFKMMEKKFDHMDNKLNLIIGIVLGSVILPVGLHLLKLI